MEGKRKISISITEQDCEKLNLLADEVSRSRAGYIRRILSAYLREIEKDSNKKIT